MSRFACDPPIRDDGRCAVCGGERPEPAARDADPFCSVACVHRWYAELERAERAEAIDVDEESTTA